MSTTQIYRLGIVEGVRARRKAGEVKSLNVTARFKTDLETIYNYGDDTVEIDEIDFSVAPTSGINPGDLVTIEVNFTSPDGQRFLPALETSSQESVDADTA